MRGTRYKPRSELEAGQKLGFHPGVPHPEPLITFLSTPSLSDTKLLKNHFS